MKWIIDKNATGFFFVVSHAFIDNDSSILLHNVQFSLSDTTVMLQNTSLMSAKYSRDDPVLLGVT